MSRSNRSLSRKTMVIALASAVVLATAIAMPRSSAAGRDDREQNGGWQGGQWEQGPWQDGQWPGEDDYSGSYGYYGGSGYYSAPPAYYAPPPPAYYYAPAPPPVFYAEPPAYGGASLNFVFPLEFH